MATPEPERHTSETKPNDHRDSKLWKSLDLISKVSSVGTIMFAVGRLISHLINFPTIVTDLAVLALAIAFTISLLKSDQFSRLTKRLLPVICIVLAVMLIWLMFVKRDSWLVWNDNVLDFVKGCEGKGDPCLGAALANNGIPKPTSDLVLERLSNDLKAGVCLMQNEAILAMLDRRIGIKKHFLGAGFALPWGTGSYKDARIPEYLVPNHKETHEDALAWRLSPKSDFLYNTVEEIVTGQLSSPPNPKEKPYILPSPINSARREKLVTLIRGAFKNPNVTPPVIRFQQFPGKPSEKFGHDKADRVFFLNLEAVWNMKLIDAVRVSGHVNDSEIGNEPLYIWVFWPGEYEEAVPATWGEIIPRLKNWVQVN